MEPWRQIAQYALPFRKTLSEMYHLAHNNDMENNLTEAMFPSPKYAAVVGLISRVLLGLGGYVTMMNFDQGLAPGEHLYFFSPLQQFA